MARKETTQEEGRFIKFLESNNINYDNVFQALIEVGNFFDKKGIVRSWSNDYYFNSKYQTFCDDYKDCRGTFIALSDTRVDRTNKYWIMIHTMLSKEEIIGYFKLKAFT